MRAAGSGATGRQRPARFPHPGKGAGMQPDTPACFTGPPRQALSGEVPTGGYDPSRGTRLMTTQKLPLNVANSVASRADFCAVVVLRPMLLPSPHRFIRAPSTAVA